MIVTIALAAIIFLALGGALAGSLRSLAVQKARTQGNEVATLSIEALQNLSYDTLGVCAPAVGAPADLDEPAAPASSCVGVSASVEDDPGWGEHPCRAGAPTSGLGFVRSSYACVRNNLSYTVRRYVAWGDDAQTTKRLAVFVKWRDNVGEHEVSQQSSLRAPGAQDIAGLPTPKITAVSVNNVPAPNPSSVVLVAPGGNPSAPIHLDATTTGLKAESSTTSGDKVYVTFTVLDATNAPDTISIFLTSPDGTNWDGDIPTSHRFGNGSQYFVFSTIRAQDGKGNSVVSPKVVLDDGTNAPVPLITTATVTPAGGGSDIQITSGGALVPATIDLIATTDNSSGADVVQVVFESRTGTNTTSLQATSCSNGTCTWVGKIERDAGYSFTTGLKKFYFTISQPFIPGQPGSGSTSAEERQVNFTL